MKNLIFLTMSRIADIERRGIYTDLLRKFRGEGWGVFIVTPNERSMGKPTMLVEKNGVHILGVRTLNLQKTSIIEKGFGQVLVEGQYKRAIKHYLQGIAFDLILYSTPPITFSKVISSLKLNNPNAKTYLLLKDIFPQNAVDLGMMSKAGVKGVLYRIFRKKEKKLYAQSDHIGCMSPANVNYIISHNPEIPPEKVEVAPNSIELSSDSFENIRPYSSDSRIESIGGVQDNSLSFNAIRKKFGLPTDRPIFIYGGNLGKPQAIPFLISCLRVNSNRDDCHIVIVGTGTELSKLKAWFSVENPRSVTVMDGLPKQEYDHLLRVCDVGLIFLDHRFTIPNFPSRLLSYLENKMPVLCTTDTTCDMGRIAEENGFGYWCESKSVLDFTFILDKMIHSDIRALGERGYEFLCANYLVQNTYQVIVNHLNDV